MVFTLSTCKKHKKQIDKAYDFIKDVVADGASVLFVGQKQAQDAVEQEAKKCEQFYVSHRWLG